MPRALITGATSGIGAAFARRLAADGFDLVLLARDTKRLNEAAETYRAKYRVDVEVLTADLSTDKGLKAAESRLSDSASPIDLLVNNAGFGHPGKFLAVSVSDELTMLRVHCEAVLRLTHAVLPGMIERHRGGIINVASIAAFLTRGTYGASKAWVVSFSQGVAQDIAGKEVNVLAVCPGFVHTEFHERANQNVSGIPEFMWLAADKVVDGALRALRRNALVSVPGAQYKALVGLGRLVPRGVAGRLSARTGRRYNDKTDA